MRKTSYWAVNFTLVSIIYFIKCPAKWPCTQGIKYLGYFIIFFFFNWGKLFYNVVLVSAIQQCESAISIHMSPSLLNFPLIPYSIPPLQNVTEHWISAPCIIQQISTGYLILHMVMYMFQCDSLNLYHPHLPPLCPQVCSLCLHLYLDHVNRFIKDFPIPQMVKKVPAMQETQV